jgi:hypothetical protein
VPETVEGHSPRTPCSQNELQPTRIECRLMNMSGLTWNVKKFRALGDRPTSSVADVHLSVVHSRAGNGMDAPRCLKIHLARGYSLRGGAAMVRRISVLSHRVGRQRGAIGARNAYSGCVQKPRADRTR